MPKVGAFKTFCIKLLGAKHVVTAANGYVALEIAMTPEVPIDFIISDLDMPAMDGLEFVRHVGEA